MKLNLGCFYDTRRGFVNLDKEAFNHKVDVVHNLDELPYPFKDNTFDEILVINVLEHLNIDRIDFYEELHRICENDAIVRIKVPFKDKIWRHTDHRGMGFTFEHFKRLCNQKDYITRKRFELIKLTHEPTTFARFIPNELRRILSYFINNIIEDIYVELRVVK